MAKQTRKKLGNPMAVATVASAAKKAAPEAKKATKKINDDTKGALSWVIVGGVGLLTLIVLRTINNASKVGDTVGDVADAAGGLVTKNAELASSVLDEVIKVVKDPDLNASNSQVAGVKDIPITVTPTQAQNKANLLLEAMDRPGTNFDRVKEALTGITIADYALVADKFGTPRYNPVLGVKSSWPYSKRNLSYWLVAELDNNEISEIQNAFPGLF